MEVERAGEEVLFRFLVLLPWEGPELGLCGLASEEKTTCYRFAIIFSVQTTRLLIPAMISNNLSIPRQ